VLVACVKCSRLSRPAWSPEWLDYGNDNVTGGHGGVRYVAVLFPPI
jgi:hypothetical protein